jgi:F-type H+-transporting ATPase subunit b
MNLMTPSIGLFFWQFFVFVLLIFILNRFVWNPIISHIQKREQIIIKSLKESQYITYKMNTLNQKKQDIINEAVKKKEQIISYTKEQCIKIKKDTQHQAMLQRNDIIKIAKLEIRHYKVEAIQELQKYILHNSILLTKKILINNTNAKYNKEYILSILDKL